MAKLPSLKIGIISGALSGLLITSAGLYITHNTNHGTNRTDSLSSVNTSNKQPVLGDSTTNNNQQVSQAKTSATQPSSQPTNTHPTSTTTQNTTTKPVATRPKPTATGIEVITPDPGSNQTIYIPLCEFNPPMGNPPPCINYKPISFTLATTYSDGSTSPISWSAATVDSYNTAHERSFIPQLLHINVTNDTLELGNAPGYWLGSSTQDAVYPINVTYQQWTYTKYIHIYVTNN